jgi:hypothetical protein
MVEYTRNAAQRGRVRRQHELGAAAADLVAQPLANSQTRCGAA